MKCHATLIFNYSLSWIARRTLLNHRPLALIVVSSCMLSACDPAPPGSVQNENVAGGSDFSPPPTPPAEPGTSNGELPIRVEVSTAGGDEPWLRLLRLDGSWFEYFGPIADGVPQSLDRIRMIESDGSTAELFFWGAPQPAELRMSDGRSLKFTWADARRGRGTLFDALGNERFSFTFDADDPSLPVPDFIDPSRAALRGDDRSQPAAPPQTPDPDRRSTTYVIRTTDCDGRPVPNLGPDLQLIIEGSGQQDRYTPRWNGSEYELSFSRPRLTSEQIEDACVSVTGSTPWKGLCYLQPVWPVMCYSAAAAAVLSPIPVADEAAVTLICARIEFALIVACQGPAEEAPSLSDLLCQSAEEIIAFGTQRPQAWYAGAVAYATAPAEACGTRDLRESQRVQNLPGNDLVVLSLDLCPRFERHAFDLNLSCADGAVSARQSRFQLPGSQDGITVAQRVENPDGGGTTTQIEGPVPLAGNNVSRSGVGSVENRQRLICNRFGFDPVEKVTTLDTTAHTLELQEFGRGRLHGQARSDILLSRTIETLRQPDATEAAQLNDDRVTCLREQYAVPFGLQGRHEVLLRRGEGLTIAARARIDSSEGQTGGRIRLQLRPTLLGGIPISPPIELCVYRPTVGVEPCESERATSPDTLITFESALRAVSPNGAAPPELDCIGIELYIDALGEYSIDDVGVQRGLMELEWDLEVTPTP